MENIYKNAWEQSYKNFDNYIFYPEYHVIAFVARYIKRKIGLNEYVVKRNFEKALDLGCGIGSNMFFLDDYKFDCYGIDFSENAIAFAKERATSLNRHHMLDKFIVANAEEIPFGDNTFDFVISHGVLDSMPLQVAKNSIKEAHRVLNDNGLFYLDLISGDGVNLPLEFNGEVVVSMDHEKNTIQLYYNWQLINQLINNKFEILYATMITTQSLIQTSVDKRRFLVLKKI